MLKKRLLASAMASIMAVSTLGATVIADEPTTTTEATTATTAVKSKEDLAALLEKYGAKFRDDTVFSYATAPGTAMIDALEFGDYILAKADAEEADYTAAYLMITNVAKDLIIYSAADVKALVAKCKAVYDTNNILNEEIMDNIYDTTAFATFEDAYDDAANLSSDDAHDITETYVALNTAYNNVLANKLTVVSKAMFAALDKQINKIMEKSNAYETWRRGTAKTAVAWGTADVSNHNGSTPLTWGMLLDEDTASYAHDWWLGYNSIGYYKSLAQTTYDNFASIATTGKTTDTSIVDIYTAAKNAADTADSFKADSYSTARKATVSSLIALYKDKMVSQWALTSDQTELIASTNTTVEDVVNNLIELTGLTYAQLFGTAELATSMKIAKDCATFYIVYDKDSGVITDATTSKPTTGMYRTYKAGTTINLFDYVNFKYGINTTSYTDIPVYLANALVFAYSYIDGIYTCYSGATLINIMDILSPGVVTSYDGAAKEWAVIYRYLVYAMMDAGLMATTTTYTLEQMYTALQESYKADTYESAVFSDELEGVVAIRKMAHEFYKLAKKMTDFNAATTEIPVTFTWRGQTETVTMTTSKLYKLLAWDSSFSEWFGCGLTDYTKVPSVEDFCNKLKNYPYSYGEIYDIIGEAAEMADEFNADDTFKALIDAVAKNLSLINEDPTVKDSTYDDGIKAWDEERILIPTNRLLKSDNDCLRKSLQTSYEALVAAMTALENPAVVLGDANSDGKVDMNDALLVLKVSVGIDVEYNKEAADYTKDGTVNVKDALEIMKAALA